MTTIHHNTLTRAKANQATIEIHNENSYTAYMGSDSARKHSHTATKAAIALNGCLLRNRISKEMPALEVYGQDIITVVAIDTNGEEHELAMERGDKFNENVLINTLRKRIDGMSVEIPNSKSNKMYIKKEYKQKYADKGDQSHCGDWLAKFLKDKFLNADTKTFDQEMFTEFLIENEVNMSGKWAKLPASGQNGWQGRYRMNGRQKLELKVAARGWVVYQGEKTLLPEDEWLAISDKHPKIETEEMGE